ncbi:MAG TPA: HAD family phosphatase [Candidatus Limnocylindrales bacterium]|nr:HAD family phosphatase [Candidatus Limnocylindrales bacterium]
MTDAAPQTRAVLFDFGGVFTESPFEAAREFGREIGVDPHLMLTTVFGPYDQDTDHPWHRLERGEILLTDARSQILDLGQQHGFEADLFKVLAALGSKTGPRETFSSRARRLRAAGIPTAVITNNAREFQDAWRAMVPVDELFDFVVDSSFVGYRKPDPRIFRHALERLGIEPHQAMFFDDFEGNVRAARELGIRAHLVEPDPAAALAELDQVLVTLGA